MSYNNRGSDTLLAVLFGAALGAAAVILSDKDSREKAVKKLEDLKSKGGDLFDEYEGRALSYKDWGRDKLIEKLEELQAKLEGGKSNGEKKKLSKQSKA